MSFERGACAAQASRLLHNNTLANPATASLELVLNCGDIILEVHIEGCLWSLSR